MEAERWQRVKEVFQHALDLPAEARSEYIESACAGDDELRGEVDSLLASSDDSENFLSTAALDYVEEDETGDRVGPYQIVRKIGAGGMGAVYLAERVDEFRQKVALKLMHRGMDSRMVVSRFRHERQILAGLDHPNIARLLDGGATAEGQPYFVMEYVEGSPIDEYCRRRALSINDRLKLFRLVCGAVQYAHQNLVVHRDIKPGNILVTEDCTPKLLDFGIAKLLRREVTAETAALTQAGMRLMTPEYASPEQVMGFAITTATDGYSLGIVLYELLTGRMPYEFADRSQIEIERAICHQEPHRPGTLDRDLETIVLKALEKEPARRYGSAEQLSEDIRRHLEGLPIAARPATFVYRSRKFVRRNRTMVAAAVLVVISLTTGLIVAQQQRARAERRFNDVRRVAESFLFEFDEKIKDLAGSLPARQLLVQRALEYLSDLSGEAAGEPGLSRDLAEAYLKVGDIQGNPYVSDMGDTAGAIESYRRALAISETLVRRTPNDQKAREYLVRAHRSIGELSPLRDDPAGAVAHFREAISILESGPPDPSSRLELAKCYETLSDLLGRIGQINLGDTKGAREAIDKALAIDDSLLSSDPTNLMYQRANAVHLMKLGDLLAGANDWDGAFPKYRQSQQLLEAAHQAEPANAEVRRFLNNLDRKMAETYASRGQNREALEQYVKACDTARQAMLADPTNKRTRQGYAINLKERADFVDKIGDHKASLALYREVLDLIGVMYGSDRSNNLLKGQYAEMLIAVGGIALDRRVLTQGLTLTRELADRQGATPSDLANYANALIDCPIADLHNAALAIAYARKAVEQTKHSEASFLDTLARAYAEAGDQTEAAATEEQAVALMPVSQARKDAEDRLVRYRATLRKK